MRILLVFALIIIAAGGYLAYFNEGTATLTIAQDRQVEIGLVPLVLGAVTVGLAMGFLGTLWHDAVGFFTRIGSKRRRKHGEKIRTLFRAADRERLAGRTAKALELYKKVNKADPEHLPTIARMGDLARARGAAKDAISLHRLAFRLDPDDPAHRLALIEDQLSIGGYEAAVQLTEAGLDEDPKNQSLLARLRDSRAAQGEWDAAIAAQDRLTRTTMEGLDSHQEAARLTGLRYEGAMALINDGKGTQARHALNELIKGARTFAPAYMTLGELLHREGNTADALAAYREGYEQTRDESFLPPIENLFISHMEDPRQALRYFNALAERDPASLRLRFFLGRIYYRLEMIDDALHVFSQLEQEVDRFPELADMLGRINLRRGDLAEAMAAFSATGPALNYVCGECGLSPTGWAARCLGCGSWGRITPHLHIAARGEAKGLLPAPA